jgi:transposase
MMIGQKDRVFRQHVSVSLEDLVPENNFYRQVERCLDLSFVRDLAADFYADIGRPSIDPVVFFNLQLIAFFEGARSERQLMEMVNLKLAHRWYIGYDLNEAVPDHSSLSKIRERYGFEVFQGFFEKIIEICLEANLVCGEELYLDSTKVRANASINGLVDRDTSELENHLVEDIENEESPSTKMISNTMENVSPVSGNLPINELQMAASAQLIQMAPPCGHRVAAALYWVTEINMWWMGEKPGSFCMHWSHRHQLWITPPCLIRLIG